MNDPLNQLPVDPEWLAKVNQTTADAAAELECMVLLLAIQENGKLSMTIEGIPESGPMADAAKDVPGMLISLAMVCADRERRDVGETRQ